MTADIKNELSRLSKVGSMMDTDTFWDIIQKANAHDTKTFNKNLKTELSSLSLKSLIEFNRRYFDVRRDLKTYEIMAVHVEMNGGDPIEPTILFHMWIINKGKEVFDLALKTPIKLIEIGNYTPYDMELIKTTDVAKEIFKKKTGQKMEHYIDYSVNPKKGKDDV